nr:MAG TPA: hypothetical protein [Caudoviricetes sp.]
MKSIREARLRRIFPAVWVFVWYLRMTILWRHDDGGCYKSRGENVINGKNREAVGKYGKKN